MCPFCLTTLGLVVAGAASTGGLAALVVKGFPARRSPDSPNGGDPIRGENAHSKPHKSEERRNHDGSD
jgi:hypothetical protein